LDLATDAVLLSRFGRLQTIPSIIAVIKMGLTLFT